METSNVQRRFPERLALVNHGRENLQTVAVILGHSLKMDVGDEREMIYRSTVSVRNMVVRICTEQTDLEKGKRK